MTLAAWFHSLSPFVLRFGADFGIRWYGLAYLAGFAAAYFALRAMSRRGLIALPHDRVGDAMLWLIGGVLVGGRLGYALVYDRGLFITWMDHAPWWGVLAINQGGMASHGGIAGVILAAWRISRGFRDEQGRLIGRTTLMHTLDAAALVTPAGMFFGRLANFINGELLGRIVTPPGVEGPWWAVQYPQELDQAKENELLHKLEPGNGLVQTPEQWQKILDLAREVAPNGNVLTGLRRLAHDGSAYAAQLKPLISSRHPSQLYQAAAEGLILAAVLWAIWAKPRKTGVIGAWFMMTYGVLRVVTEIWRLPDVQMGRTAGLSMGQWLSAGMVVVGALTLWHAVRKPGEKLGGWRTTRPG